MMHKPLHTAATLATTLLLLTGCGEKSQPADTPAAAPKPAATSNATTDPKVVSWPAMTELDEQVHILRARIDKADFDAARALVPAFQDAIRAVATDKIPANVANAAKVEILQLDLEGLAEAFDGIAEKSNVELQQAFEAVDAVSHELLVASGVPHVHEGHDHDHDHEGHDHDH